MEKEYQEQTLKKKRDDDMDLFTGLLDPGNVVKSQASYRYRS